MGYIKTGDHNFLRRDLKISFATALMRDAGNSTEVIYTFRERLNPWARATRIQA
ncbi:MAG: hypothetical protein QXU11_11360 [Thermoproteota archaeon]